MWGLSYLLLREKLWLLSLLLVVGMGVMVRLCFSLFYALQCGFVLVFPM